MKPDPTITVTITKHADGTYSLSGPRPLSFIRHVKGKAAFKRAQKAPLNWFNDR